MKEFFGELVITTPNIINIAPKIPIIVICSLSSIAAKIIVTNGIT